LRVETVQLMADRQRQLPGDPRQGQGDNECDEHGGHTTRRRHPAPPDATATLLPAHRLSQPGFETFAGRRELALRELQQAGGQDVGIVRHAVPP
jgi:hypothetical protein